MELLLRRRLMTAGDTYLDASYITFTGDQYIDLGIYGNNNTEYIIDFYITTLVQGQSRSLFGYYDPSNPTTKSLNLHLGYGAANTRYGNAYANLDWRSGYRYTTTLNPTGMTVNRSDLSSPYYSTTWSPSSFTTEGTLKVGYTGTGLYFIGDIYFIEAFNQTEGVTFWLTPAYSVRLNQFGLLNQADHRFYYSATGVPLSGVLR